MVRPTVDVVHVGSAARDVAGDEPGGWRLGGGVSYGALTTARLGLRTAAIVGVDEASAAAADLDLLRAAGVSIHPVHLDEGPVFQNVHTGAGRDQIALAVGQPLAPPTDLPAGWRAPRAWSLVPVAGEIDDRWAAVLGPAAVVALGWQGWLRRLVAGRAVGRRAPRSTALTRRADLIGVSTEDLAAGTEPAALLRFLRPGVRLLVTDGPAGGRVVASDATEPGAIVTERFQAIPSTAAVDPTGAGDVFLAAFLAATVRPDLVGSGRGAVEPLRFAAAAASLVVQAHGLRGVPDLDAVWARLATTDAATSGSETGRTARVVLPR